MIFEQATLQVDPDNAKAFEQAIASCAPLFRDAQGCISLSLERIIETSGRYVLRIGWNTVEDHTEVFTKTGSYAEFIKRVGPFLTETPGVVHVAPTPMY